MRNGIDLQLYVSGAQSVNSIERVCSDQRQDVSLIDFMIDVVELCRANQAVHRGGWWRKSNETAMAQWDQGRPVLRMAKLSKASTASLLVQVGEAISQVPPWQRASFNYTNESGCTVMVIKTVYRQQNTRCSLSSR